LEKFLKKGGSYMSNFYENQMEFINKKNSWGVLSDYI